jgi:hypothetical protein
VIGVDGSLELEDAAAATAVDDQAGVRDRGLSGDGRLLYEIDPWSQVRVRLAVGDGGSLAAIGSYDGLPATVAGLAAS